MPPSAKGTTDVLRPRPWVDAPADGRGPVSEPQLEWCRAGTPGPIQFGAAAEDREQRRHAAACGCAEAARSGARPRPTAAFESSRASSQPLRALLRGTVRVGLDRALPVLSAVFHGDTRRRGESAPAAGVRAGIALAHHPPEMQNVFIAGQELVTWEIEAVGRDGPYRLTMRHAAGSIVEYYPTTEAALTRERELEALLLAARGVARCQAASRS